MDVGLRKIIGWVGIVKRTDLRANLLAVEVASPVVLAEVEVSSAHAGVNLLLALRSHVGHCLHAVIIGSLFNSWHPHLSRPCGRPVLEQRRAVDDGVRYVLAGEVNAVTGQ